MKRDILLVVTVAVLGIVLSQAQTRAADVPITRVDIDRIVRALDKQTDAIREAGRHCR